MGVVGRKRGLALFFVSETCGYVSRHVCSQACRCHRNADELHLALRDILFARFDLHGTHAVHKDCARAGWEVRGGGKLGWGLGGGLGRRFPAG